ncbi:MAG: hypothetical protein PHF84_04090 [bacterium]|nr:hypothetical protein [bacterium]
MFNRYKFFLIVIMAFCMAGCSNKDVTIEGHVFKDSTQKLPLAGVKIESGKVKTASHDTTGYFVVEGEVVESETVINLFFSKTNFKNKTVSVLIKSKDDSTEALAADNSVEVSLETNN